MASRRLRLKAVINLPQRRGKEQNAPSTEERDVNNTVPTPPRESNATEHPPISVSEEIKYKIEPCATVSSNPELVKDNSSNEPELRSNVRKRLKPAVNLPAAISRKQKIVRFSEPVVEEPVVEKVVLEEPVLEVNVPVTETKNDANENSDMEVFEEVEIESSTEEDDTSSAPLINDEFVIPTSKNIPPKSSKIVPPPVFINLSSQKGGVLKSPVKSLSRLSRPSPQLLVNTALRQKSLPAPSDSPDDSGVIESPDALTLPDSAASESSQPLSADESSVDAASIPLSILRGEPHDTDLAPSAKTEKRTTHRRLRKNGAGEMLTKARRDFHIKFGNNTPDKKQLTMFDLIFYNPTTNPMKPVEAISPEKDRVLKKTDEISERLAEESVDDVNATGSDDESNTAMPAPQVKVGPDGQLIIDEKSLVIETTGAQKRRFELANSAVVMDYGVGNSTTYSSFTNRVKSKEWSKQETLKFYRALNSVGTDFLLMQSIFPKRTRKDLKQKFKKEDRLNRDLVDKALKYPAEFDIAQLEKDLAQEEKENEEKRQRELLLRKEKEKSKPKRNEKRVARPKSKVMKSFLAKSLDASDTGPVHSITNSSKEKEAVPVSSGVAVDVSIPSKTPKPKPAKKTRKLKQRVKKEFVPSSSSSCSSSSLSSSSDEECSIYSDRELSYQPAVQEQKKSSLVEEVVQELCVETEKEHDQSQEQEKERDQSKEQEKEHDQSQEQEKEQDQSKEQEKEQDEKRMQEEKRESPPLPTRTISVADDVDFSSSDDEITFLKTTQQTRYGRIPQRRVLSSESEEESDTEAPPQPAPEPASPDFSNVEPGSIVIFASPGHSNYQLFMVGPREPGTEKSKMTPIGVTLTPEVLATMTDSIQVLGERIVPSEPASGSTEQVANAK